MPITGARTTNHHILDGVIIFFANLGPIVEQIVAQSVESRHVDPEISDL